MTSRILIAAITAANVHAAVIISDDFSGDGTAGLDGTSPDINATTAGNAWVSNANFRNDGLVVDDGNIDRSAYIDLGPTFSFAEDTTYTLEMSWSGLDNGLWFAGFVDEAPTVGDRLQTQGNNFLARVRSSDLSDPGVFPFTNPPETTHAGATTAAGNVGAVTLTLETNSLSDASFSVDDSPDVSIDLTATDYRYLSVGFEDAGFAASTDDDQFDSLTFTQVPEPAAGILGACGLLTLLRRRRG